jgi:exosortase/archaeosortase family protein
MHPRDSWRPQLMQGLRFLVTLMLLQLAWHLARGTVVERAVIDDATVGTAVSVIHRIAPTIAIRGSGPRITAPGGGVNVLNGCEGTEVLFLLFAALSAAPLSARARVAGVVLGTLWVFALNQCRLIVLFFTYRDDRALFDQLHGVVAPMLLIVLVLAFFQGLSNWDARRAGASAGTPG